MTDRSHPLDTCYCGDFRKDHANDVGSCAFTNNHPGGVWCRQFRFSAVASPRDIAQQGLIEHWLIEAERAKQEDRARWILIRDGF